MCILKITFYAFFKDTKQLVTIGVHNNITQSLSDADSLDDHYVATICGKECKKNLKQWLKLKNPLVYGHVDKKKTSKPLMQAVIRNTQDISHSLPYMLDHAMTPSSFADIHLGMSHPHFPANLYAPVISNGSFLPSFKLAHKHLLTLDRTEPSSNVWIMSMFLHAIKYIDISYAPSHLSRTLTRGALNKKAIYNSWTYLGFRMLLYLTHFPHHLTPH